MGISSIMVVDDSEADQFLVSALINAYDSQIEVFQAYDGQEALEVLGELDTAPSVIFLDVNMPRMNGFEFLEEYTKTASTTSVVTLLTSSDQERDKDKAEKYECVLTYFSKPLSMDHLDKISNLLEK